ncbi:MAG: Peroxisome biosynthesis protein pex1 [Sclerophora amabilis]|nr:MAG: Peroxisome biosynthesis protein pex1 [Sclerophora amabilis]
MAPSKTGSNASEAELAFVQLKNCLVNLPSSLVSVLVNANTPVQNVVVELSFRPQHALVKGYTSNNTQKSVYVGWTGMPSRRRLAPIVNRDGIRGHSSGREREVAVLEIDATFARMIGLLENQMVGISLHPDPPLAHTVNIEPLTSADWEIIELHANFLELNLLSQIRALPNPSYNPPNNNHRIEAHPLTLHLSPTSTANIVITSLSPAQSSTTAFAKISPDAEVIVAPKSRVRNSHSGGREGRSVGSVGQRSVGERSGTSTARQRSYRDDAIGRGAVFLRAVDRAVAVEWFDDDEAPDQGLHVWVDSDAMYSKSLRGAQWVTVSVIKPAGLNGPVDPQQQTQPAHEDRGNTADIGTPASKIVAKILEWEDAPDSQHVVLSSALCAALGSEGMVGGIVRLEAAPQQTQKGIVKSLKVYPFTTNAGKTNEGLKFGGSSRAEKDGAARQLQQIFGKQVEEKDGLLGGPLTDGMVLGNTTEVENGWQGGLLKFEPPLVSTPADAGKPPWGWILGAERKLDLEVLTEVPKPSHFSKPLGPGEKVLDHMPAMVGIEPVINQLTSLLSHSSSVLLTGGLGSGKSSLAQLVAHNLRRKCLFYVTYFPCRKLVTDEMRVSTIKDTLSRLFMSASWGARLGGRGLVVLDDLDKLCPVETELQVGGDNGRSRQISELLRSIIREHCGLDTGVVLLATAHGKEAMNNVIIGGHVVREIVSLKAPDKNGRRKVLELLADAKVGRDSKAIDKVNGTKGEEGEGAWMDGSSVGSRPGSASRKDGFSVDDDLDFLDVAGQTDGYMPGDLVLLVSRARNEALIRSVKLSSISDTISLAREDFTQALEGFMPASLRNVTLQRSTTTFDSIGGLHSTRKTLLETLQYPTTYAPIFAQCPLRLRSGLLLYGYPGCGKTMLASAVAGECGLNFISVKGPEILNKYIGASEKSVRDLFERAEAAKPCVLFFDEFDSIAPKRGHDSTGVTDRVVNQLLTQMDGAEGLSGVYVLAATSRPDLIDPALLRPGRLDKSLLCDLPSQSDRTDILRAVSKKLKMSDDILETGIDEIAKRTEGYSGADLQALVYNAQLEAIHDVLDSQQDLTNNNTTTTTARGSRGGSRSTGEKKQQQWQQRKTNGASTSNSKDFISFLFDEGADKADRDRRTQSNAGNSTWLAEQAAIVAKLDALKLARRRQRQLRREQREHHLSLSSSSRGAGHRGNSHGEGNDAEKSEEGDEAETEVVIRWKHVAASMRSTRPSIGAQDRARLVAIYREFVVGRNGEMPSGQGGMEVGGRSSLM